MYFPALQPKSRGAISRYTWVLAAGLRRKGFWNVSHSGTNGFGAGYLSRDVY